MKQLAKQLINHKISVLPTKINKAPAIGSWKRLQSTYLNDEEIEELFENNYGIAVVCGLISGNLEVIDFDNKMNSMQRMYDSFMSNEYVSALMKKYKFPIETTVSGGYHIYYRCEEEIDNNRKLASVYDESVSKPVCIIETRGEGGYLISSPTKGYNWIKNDLFTIPTITKEERDILIKACLMLDEVIDEQPIIQPNPTNSVYKGESLDVKIGQQIDTSFTYVDRCYTLLRNNGWKSKDNINWTRPGKESGISATFGVCRRATDKALGFKVFTSNAYPFEAERCYFPFAIITILEHNGDFHQSAKVLSEEIGLSYKSKQRVISASTILAEVDKNFSESSSVIGSECLEFEQYIKDRWDLRLNVISNVLEWKTKNSIEWDTCNENTIYMSLSRDGIKFKKEQLTSLLASDFIPRFDPFKDYFENLPEFDGISYFDEFTSYLDMKESERGFFSTMLKKHFVRSIKCALEPQFYNRFVFTIQSRRQEFGKSRLIRFLNPFGVKYFSEESLSGDKDQLIALTENFMYSLEEIDGMKQVGLGKLKAMVAKSYVNVRLPYGKQKVNKPRCANFFGSTNMCEFLQDDINTRWLIFNIDGYDVELFNKINIHDLWSEAYAFYKTDDEQYWDLTLEEKARRELSNLRFKQTSIEQEIIMTYFEPSDTQMSLMEIAKAIQRSSCGLKINLDPSRLSDILIDMGFELQESFVFNNILKTFNIHEKGVR